MQHIVFIYSLVNGHLGWGLGRFASDAGLLLSALWFVLECIGQQQQSPGKAPLARDGVGNDWQGVQPLVGHSGHKRRHRGGSLLLGHLVFLYLLSCIGSNPVSSSSSRFSLERLFNPFFKDYLVNFDSPGHYFVHMCNGLNGGFQKDTPKF